jgi:hypothetical protein
MELCIVCPQLVLEIMGIEWIVMALLKPGICNRQITELVCQIIVYWLDSPYLRENIKIRKLLEVFSVFPLTANINEKIIFLI